MNFFDEMSEAWNKAKTNNARPMECPLDYFGEGYLAAQLKQKAELAAAKANILEREVRVEVLTLAAHRALELADDLYSYCIDQWRWKYGKAWDAELVAIRAALAEPQSPELRQQSVDANPLSKV